MSSDCVNQALTVTYLRTGVFHTALLRGVWSGIRQSTRQNHESGQALPTYCRSASTHSTPHGGSIAPGSALPVQGEVGKQVVRGGADANSFRKAQAAATSAKISRPT